MSFCGGSTINSWRILSSDQSALTPLIWGHLHFVHFDFQLMSAQNNGASSSDVYSIFVILMNTCYSPPDVIVLRPSLRRKHLINVSIPFNHRTNWRVCSQLANLIRQNQNQPYKQEVNRKSPTTRSFQGGRMSSTWPTFLMAHVWKHHTSDRWHCELNSRNWCGAHCWRWRSARNDGSWCGVNHWCENNVLHHGRKRCDFINQLILHRRGNARLDPIQARILGLCVRSMIQHLVGPHFLLCNSLEHP